MEQLDLNRKNVETELKEVLKLCRWERPDNYLYNETTKRTRQKVKKLIQKFTVSYWFFIFLGDYYINTRLSVIYVGLYESE